MRYEQLQYFLETVQTHSVSIAAENLYITQPALSRAIKTLEKELGLLLFSRTADGVRLTESGETLLPIFQTIMANFNQLLTTSHELATQKITPCDKQTIIIISIMKSFNKLLIF